MNVTGGRLHSECWYFLKLELLTVEPLWTETSLDPKARQRKRKGTQVPETMMF